MGSVGRAVAPLVAAAWLAAGCAGTMEEQEGRFLGDLREQIDTTVRQEGPTTEYLVGLLQKRMEYRDRTLVSPDGRTVTRFFPVKAGKGASLRSLVQDNLQTNGLGEGQAVQVSSYDRYDWFYTYASQDQRGGADTPSQVHATDLLQVTGSPGGVDYVERVIAEAEYRPQVLLDVAVLQVSLTDSTYLGTKTSARSTDFDTNNNAAGLETDLSLTVDPEFGGTPGLTLRTVQSDVTIEQLIEALRERESVTVLSRPTLLVVSGCAADISTGQEIPEPQYSPQGNNSSIIVGISSRHVGVSLHVLPTVRKGAVSMEIQPEVSNILAFVDLGGIKQPVYSRSYARTSVEVASGETLILGGLYVRKTDRGEQGIPGLIDVPYLQYVLGNTLDTREISNLVFILKPRIIYSLQDEKAPSDPPGGE